jgi:hypothetical protein
VGLVWRADLSPAARGGVRETQNHRAPGQIQGIWEVRNGTYAPFLIAPRNKQGRAATLAHHKPNALRSENGRATVVAHPKGAEKCATKTTRFAPKMVQVLRKLQDYAGKTGIPGLFCKFREYDTMKGAPVSAGGRSSMSRPTSRRRAVTGKKRRAEPISASSKYPSTSVPDHLSRRCFCNTPGQMRSE